MCWEKAEVVKGESLVTIAVGRLGKGGGREGNGVKLTGGCIILKSKYRIPRLS